MKTQNPTTTKTDDKKTEAKSPIKIKTDFPLSEKDEVKAAEHQLQKGQKKKE